MSLECAVCGTSRITQTVETETGVKPLCDTCLEAVTEQARKVAASEAAVRRFHTRKAWELR